MIVCNIADCANNQVLCEYMPHWKKILQTWCLSRHLERQGPKLRHNHVHLQYLQKQLQVSLYLQEDQLPLATIESRHPVILVVSRQQI